MLGKPCVFDQHEIQLKYWRFDSAIWDSGQGLEWKSMKIKKIIYWTVIPIFLSL
jgi:hypothetical protein